MKVKVIVTREIDVDIGDLEQVNYPGYDKLGTEEYDAYKNYIDQVWERLEELGYGDAEEWFED